MITIQQIINTKKGKSAALKQKALKINSFVKLETVNYSWLLKKDKKGECFALEKNEYYENKGEYFGS